MTSDTDLLKEGIEVLIRSGHYKSREAILEEAFRIMLEVKPSIRQEMAVELYKSEKVSLSRAAEIAGISQEGFKNLLEIKGTKRVVVAPSEDRISEEGLIFSLDRSATNLRGKHLLNTYNNLSSGKWSEWFKIG